MLLPLRLAMVLCFWFATALAGSMESQINDLLKKQDYAALDQLYATANRETFVIYQTPGLQSFFGAIPPPRSASEDQWKNRLAQLNAWQAADAESEAASLALADFYVEYAFKARGTGWAREVSSEGWRLLSERLKMASSILDAPQKNAGTALYAHYLRAWINAPDEDKFAITRKEIAYLNKAAPRFSSAYALMGNYLLPRWNGQPGELTRYATESADRLGREDGDMLYADLLTYAAHVEEDDFVFLHHPDKDRLERGCETLIRNDGKRANHWRQRQAYAMAMLGDWTMARKQILSLGPLSANDSYYDYYWNGRAKYEAILSRSGIRNDLVAAELQESAGRLAEAEAAYLALTPDRTTNLWMAGFYLRHGEATQYANSAGAADLTIPADKASMDEAADRCIIFETLRDFKRGAPFAERFDRVRGHNFTAKTFFYEAALFSDDVAAAKNARDAIINRKTDRKSYQLAQNMLADGANFDAFQPDYFDWNDAYSRQGAIIVALRLYEKGKPEAARRLLQAALKASTYSLDSEHIRSLIYHPPVIP